MITKITPENTTKYQALFEKVNEILDLPKKDEQGTVITHAISTLDGYFQHLNEISQKDPSLIILPLDEEKFFIDGNSRKIAVPQAFTKNGVGVQGDHYAEYIYFEIDRYFENIDFGSPSITAVVEFVDANQQKHFTKAWIKYTDEKSSKVTIGWPITQDVTSKAGSIKFSVRLFELEGNSYKRSFGTLIGQLVVNPSLDFAISKAEIDNIQGKLDADVEGEVLRRMINSPAADYSADKVVSPVFLFRYKEGIGATDSCAADAGDVLNVQAIAPGSVTYSWYKDKDETTTTLQAKLVYKKLNAFKENIPIYENKGTQEAPAYRLADVSEETFANGGGPYYEIYSEYTLPSNKNGETMSDITGTYRCVAQNNMYGFSRSSDDAHNIPEGRTDEDCIIGSVVVPGPTAFGDDSTMLPGKIEIVDGGSLTVGVTGATVKDRDTYTWNFTGDDGNSRDIATTGNTCSLLDIEGTYTASVTRTRNGAVSEPKALGSCHAYKKPQPVKFITIDGISIDDSQKNQNFLVPKTATSCTITVKANGKFENYAVEWRKEESQAEDATVTILNTNISKPDENGVFSIRFNPSEVALGFYYPVVKVSKNNVEGVDEEICSFEKIGYLNIAPAGTSG